MGTALLFQMAIICSKVNYSRDTNTGQVWYSDHGDLSDCRTVCCSDHHLKNGQNCPLLRCHLNNVLASEYRTISPLFRCPIHFIGQAACYFSNGSLIQMSIIRIPTVMLSYIPWICVSLPDFNAWAASGCLNASSTHSRTMWVNSDTSCWSLSLMPKLLSPPMLQGRFNKNVRLGKKSDASFFACEIQWQLENQTC